LLIPCTCQNWRGVTTTDERAPIETTPACLALLSSSVGDSAGTRTIGSIVLLLAVLGIALLMIAMWLFRLTRPDKELLAPLEVMGERKWRRADPVWQRRRLDEVRPGDAQPLQPSVAPPDFDEAFFGRGPMVAGFADLHDDAHADGESPAHVAEPVEGPVQTVDALTVPPPETVKPDVISAPGPVTEARPLASLEPVSATPIGIERPMQLPESDIDPEIMAAAIAELDAELRLGRDPKSQTSD
jgi:hypothetical protein